MTSVNACQAGRGGVRAAPSGAVGCRPEVYQRLRERHPRIRVVFMSGYFERGPHGENPIPPGARFLAKPFTPQALSMVVLEALAEPVA